jgi:DNA-binding response OmpR family regulator
MSERRTILVIEDDEGIRRGVVDALELYGYRTLQASRGDEGLELALCEGYDLLLLDLVLPQREGFSILEELKRVRPNTPVIVLTARGAESDRLQGFGLGADDYVIKPFSLQELLARVEAVLRRSPQRPLNVHEVRFTGGVANLERCEVCYADGASCELSQRERDLLHYLAANAARAVSREELLQHVWSVDPRGLETRTVDMFVARLRDKLRDDAAEPQAIITVRGKGYKLGTAAEPV